MKSIPDIPASEQETLDGDREEDVAIPDDGFLSPSRSHTELNRSLKPDVAKRVRDLPYPTVLVSTATRRWPVMRPVSRDIECRVGEPDGSSA